MRRPISTPISIGTGINPTHVFHTAGVILCRDMMDRISESSSGFTNAGPRTIAEHEYKDNVACGDLTGVERKEFQRSFCSSWKQRIEVKKKVTKKEKCNVPGVLHVTKPE